MMTVKIQTVDESIESDGIKALAYGMLGSGKTRLCATPAAQDQPVLIGNAEGGLLSLQDLDDSVKKHIGVWRIQSFGDIEDLHTYLTNNYEFAWICLDSISEIAEVVLTNEKANNSDGRAAYGNLADIMMSMLRAFRDLPKYNIMMSAKMTRFTDEITNRTVYWPMMPGKQLTNGIGYLFDEVFALRVETDQEGNLTRWLQTSRDIQYEAKDRSGRLEMFEPPDLATIETKITSKKTIIPDTELNEKENENGEDA
jgi:hypothetical protein